MFCDQCSIYWNVMYCNQYIMHCTAQMWYNAINLHLLSLNGMHLNLITVQINYSTTECDWWYIYANLQKKVKPHTIVSTFHKMQRPNICRTQWIQYCVGVDGSAFWYLLCQIISNTARIQYQQSLLYNLSWIHSIGKIVLWMCSFQIIPNTTQSKTTSHYNCSLCPFWVSSTQSQCAQFQGVGNIMQCAVIT